ncbi:MAG: 4a-hydroxytetrahydrobiopterin dehydratase [bacterium]|nr:4a-hydroxytetrahydrobiopterin dehydratase [bacterium]
MEIETSEGLTAKKCKPCEGGVDPCSLDFSRSQLAALEGWELSEDGKMISKRWKLKNFVQAMKLLNSAAEVAEGDQHHPDLHLTGYRQVQIDLTTHAIGGLSENDFIVAAKIDAAAENIVSA